MLTGTHENLGSRLLGKKSIFDSRGYQIRTGLASVFFPFFFVIIVSDMRSLKLKLTYSRYLIFVCLHMFLPWTCQYFLFRGRGPGGGGGATVGILVNRALWLSASALLTSLIPTRPYHPYAYIWALKLISFPRAPPYRFKFGGFDLRFKSIFLELFSLSSIAVWVSVKPLWER